MNKIKIIISIFICLLIFTNKGIGQALKVDSDGNVGIGISNPTAKLELESNEFIMLNPNSTKAGILFYETGDKSYNNVEYGAIVLYDEIDDEFRIVARQAGNDYYGLTMDRRNGHIGIGTQATSWSHELYVDGDVKISGDAWVNGTELVTSDGNVKTEVKGLSGEDILNKIQQIESKKYKYKNKQEVADIIINNLSGAGMPTDTNNIGFPDFPDGEQYGLIAQEIKEVFPEVVDIDSSTMLYGINYNAFIPILLEALKAEQSLINEQQVEINKSNEKISKQNSDITELQQIVLNQHKSITQLQEEIALIKAQCCTGLLAVPQSGQELKSSTGPIKQSIAPKSKEVEPMPSLEQNNPNPFTAETRINYYLPEETEEATLCIYDMQGKPIKNYSINQMGNASHTIQGSELMAGMYLYTLIADGKEVGTKRMILTE